MAVVQVNGIKLYYESNGIGEPLIFLPGLGGTTRLWTFQLPYFQKNYHTISLDNRGSGRSDKPEGPYSMQMFAKDLHDLIAALDIDDPVNLVGASMGGLIAQAFAHHYPHCVKTMTLVCTGVSSGDPNMIFPSAEGVQRLSNPGGKVEERIDTILASFNRPDFVRNCPDIKHLYLQRKTDAQPLHAYQAQLDACSDPRSYFQRLKEIAVPVLVMHGRADKIWPLQNALTLIDELGANGELAVIDDSTNLFMQENPAEFNRILEQFLRKHA